MASPHVAGLVALMAEKDPTLTAADAEFQLESTALPIIGYNPEDQGSGLVQADAVL